MTDTIKATLPMDVQEALRKHMPEHISALLRQRLAEAELALQDKEILQSRLTQVAAQLKDQKDLKSQQADLNIKSKELADKAEELRTQRNAMLVNKLEHELETERRCSKFLEKLLYALVRNVDYRREVYGSAPAGVDQYGAVQQGQTNHSETTKAE